MKILYSFIFLLLSSLSSYAENYPMTVAERSPMTFELRSTGGNCIGCEWIAAEGIIFDSTPKDFDNFIRENNISPGTVSVAFHSFSADFVAAMNLGKRIRQMNLTTQIAKSVPDDAGFYMLDDKNAKCIDACAYAFLGGIERYVESGQLGFQQLYRAGEAQKSYNATRLVHPDLDPDFIIPAWSIFIDIIQVLQQLIDYVVELDIDLGLVIVTASARAHPYDIYFLTDTELDSYRVRREHLISE